MIMVVVNQNYGLLIIFLLATMIMKHNDNLKSLVKSILL